MRRRSGGFNPKRRILAAGELSEELRETMAREASYSGNAEHKTKPGDYGLIPPCAPRAGKTLCDADREFPKADAERLLKSGFRRGMVSEQTRGGWPQNVWAVSDDGEAFEAQLDNQVLGSYHGYPMADGDDFRIRVEEEWRRRVS